MAVSIILVGILGALIVAGVIILPFGISEPNESVIVDMLPVYNDTIETRVIDTLNVGLTEGELAKLDALTEGLGKVLYDIDEEYDPQNVTSYLLNTTPKELQDLALYKKVRSEMLSYKVLDVVMDGPNNGDALVYYLLDYENDNMAKDIYYFIMNIRFIRDGANWMCERVSSKGSASANEYVLIRDGLTGSIKLDDLY